MWHGIGAPKNTPAAIIEQLNHQINAVLADPKIKERFADTLAVFLCRWLPPTFAH